MNRNTYICNCSHLSHVHDDILTWECFQNYSPFVRESISHGEFPSHRLSLMMIWCFLVANTLRQKQNGRHFPDDIFKCIFLNEKVRISIMISLRFVSKGRINNIPALVQIMAWRQSGDKPLSEATLVSLLTQICITRPQWVKLNQLLNNNQVVSDFRSINIYVTSLYWF